MREKKIWKKCGEPESFCPSARISQEPKINDHYALSTHDIEIDGLFTLNGLD